MRISDWSSDVCSSDLRRQQSATIGTEDDDPDIVFDSGRRQTYLPLLASTLQVPQPHFAMRTDCQTFTVRRACVSTQLVALALPRYRGGLLQSEQLDTAIEHRCSEMAATGVERPPATGYTG